MPGAANRSYGIQVARLAGLPRALVERAREILRNLESGELDARGRPRLAGADGGEASPEDQLGLFAPASPERAAREDRVLETLRGLDVDRTTPLEALELLARLTADLDREDRG